MRVAIIDELKWVGSEATSARAKAGHAVISLRRNTGEVQGRGNLEVPKRRRKRRSAPMTRLTRRELLIGGTAIIAAGTVAGAAFAAETAEHSGFPRDTNTKGEHP